MPVSCLPQPLHSSWCLIKDVTDLSLVWWHWDLNPLDTAGSTAAILLHHGGHPWYSSVVLKYVGEMGWCSSTSKIDHYYRYFTEKSWNESVSVEYNKFISFNQNWYQFNYLFLANSPPHLPVIDFSEKCPNSMSHDERLGISSLNIISVGITLARSSTYSTSSFPVTACKCTYVYILL